ncbi:MAG: hypothetical protein AB7H90_12830 [Alphaproteobacteria bacterium]
MPLIKYLKYMMAAAMFLLVGAAPADAQYQWPSYQYPSYPTVYAYPFLPSVAVHPYVPTTPPEWSYNPYTSGLGPCPQRLPGDQPCKETMQPSYGQPSYWSR